jgi:hypothetical protein
MKKSRRHPQPHDRHVYRSSAPAEGRRRTRRNVLLSALGLTVAGTAIAAGFELNERQTSPAYDHETEQALGDTIRPTMRDLATQIRDLSEANPDTFQQTTTEEGWVRLRLVRKAAYSQSSSMDVIMGTTPDGRPDPQNVYFAHVWEASTPDQGPGHVNAVMFAAPGGERYAGQARPVAGRNIGWLAYNADIHSLNDVVDTAESEIFDTSSRGSWGHQLPGDPNSPVPTARYVVGVVPGVMDRAVQIAFPAR